MHSDQPAALSQVRAVLSAPTFILLLWVGCLGMAQAQTLRYLGRQVIPHAHEYAGTTVGGLSGLDYDAGSNRFLAISDDRSERQPARFYVLSLDLAEFNFRADPGHAGVRFLGVTSLRDKTGKPYAKGMVDPEAIRRGRDGNAWWVSEGNVKEGIPPAIEEIGADGTALRRLDVPRHYHPAQERGVRDNLAFESLAIADGKLYVGTENALLQDGPGADLDQPSRARLLVYDLASGKRIAEHVYVVDAVPVPPPLPGLYRTNGLVELLGGEGMLLALERSYTMGSGNSVRIFRLDLAAASNVADLESLAGASIAVVRKTLLLDLAGLGVEPDNLEGMSWGPRRPNGHPTLILISDNNFSARQITQLLAFEVQAEQVPALPYPK